MRQFHLNASQRKSNLWLGGLTTLGLLIIAAILGQIAANVETGTNLMLVVMGVKSGVLVRGSTKRGWTYAMAEKGSPIPFTWTAKRRLGVLWRTVAVLFIGLLIIGGLDGLAAGDVVLALFMAFALIAITTSGILVGLRYGWNEAQASVQSIDRAGVTP